MHRSLHLYMYLSRVSQVFYVSCSVARPRGQWTRLLPAVAFSFCLASAQIQVDSSMSRVRPIDGGCVTRSDNVAPSLFEFKNTVHWCGSIPTTEKRVLRIFGCCAGVVPHHFPDLVCLEFLRPPGDAHIWRPSREIFFRFFRCLSNGSGIPNDDTENGTRRE